MITKIENFYNDNQELLELMWKEYLAEEFGIYSDQDTGHLNEHFWTFVEEKLIYYQKKHEHCKTVWGNSTDGSFERCLHTNGINYGGIKL